MSNVNGAEQQVLDALRHVPTERWGEVVQFLNQLTPADAKPAPTELTAPPIRTAADVLSSGLVGIWADRSDIGDNHEFARKLRCEAEHRSGAE